MINQSINIPITIIYKTDLTEDFVNKIKNILFFLPFMIQNKIIYNKSLPQQIIYLEIMDKEKINWAQINLTQTKIYVDDIPFQNQTIIIKTSLILSPFEEAPSEIQSIRIKVNCSELGILREAIYESEIQFKPRFTPIIEIEAQNSLHLVHPRKNVSFKIIVKNYSNKRVKVNPNIITMDARWRPIINPQTLHIDPNSSSYFIFSILSPYEFGWHDIVQEFQINFTTQIFPLNNNSSITHPYEIILKVKNHGFAIPGFELTGLFVVLITCIFLRKNRVILNVLKGRSNQ